MHLGACVRELVVTVKDIFASPPPPTGRHAYYKGAIFFLSTVLHKILDPSITRVIMIDADLKFMTDIKNLHDLFDE